MGRLVARAAEDKVEVVMTDGEDAAVATMTPNEALGIVSQLLEAANKAATYVPRKKDRG